MRENLGVLFQVNDPVSKSKTDWKYRQVSNQIESRGIILKTSAVLDCWSRKIETWTKVSIMSKSVRPWRKWTYQKSSTSNKCTLFYGARKGFIQYFLERGWFMENLVNFHKKMQSTLSLKVIMHWASWKSNFVSDKRRKLRFSLNRPPNQISCLKPSKRGESYQADIAVDDFQFLPGKCQEIPAMPPIEELPSKVNAERERLGRAVNEKISDNL